MSMQRPNLCKMRRLWIINEALLIAVLVVGLSTAADQLLWGVPTRCGGSSIDDQGQKLSYALTCLENRRAEDVPYFYQRFRAIGEIVSCGSVQAGTLVRALICLSSLHLMIFCTDLYHA